MWEGEWLPGVVEVIERRMAMLCLLGLEIGSLREVNWNRMGLRVGMVAYLAWWGVRGTGRSVRNNTKLC